ncbi:SDR family oxidoreductase [Aquamicrobium sp. LC103]|uniref:SDR family NAD(P)-dependent oxidoreductase n=1 Tax=Aquamicrobium sp. LC103 TaxID=1120658 RepID=UPI00063ED108|nr:SDR family oxidoreductase [Aquamicrobium sp. LC103]TKT75751.1 SDR family oxidoreductase [Aquamicrobium sp. LC103]
MNELAGKAVVITGAGGGLGAAYARHAASRGAAVLVNDVDPAAAAGTVDAIVASGGKAADLAGDVSTWSFAQTLVDACIDAFGTITGLVNNAGILRPALLAQVTESDLRRMLEINVMGTAACAQAAVRRLREIGKGGSVINVASGSQAGDIALGGYAASKGGVASLTYSWAMELRGSGIRMNALSPLAETAMAGQNAHLMSLQAAGREVHYASLPPADVNAPVVSYLLSDAAAAINGQVVRIAGRQLSYVTHPLIAFPVIEDDWTMEKVADAFANALETAQQKLGLAMSSEQ